MTPEREAALRAAGVLDGSRLDGARVVLLNIYERARPAPDAAPIEEIVRGEVWFAMDHVMAGTPNHEALRHAQRTMRRRRK